MPKDHKAPGIIAAEIHMTRTLGNSSFLIVEGVTDWKFWSPRKDPGCVVIDGEGKNNVIGCIEQLDASKFRGALGVVDSDYDELKGKKSSSENLVPTDAHDLESLLCRSSALDVVLAEFGNPEKIDQFQASAKRDVRSALLDRALVFGRVRWAAIRFSLNIESKRIVIPRFVSEARWAVDEESLIEVIADLPSGAQTLRRQIAKLTSADPWHIVQGHDLIAILRIGLRKVLGDISSSVGNDQISRALRTAMSSEELKLTGFGTEISGWETRNIPYAIFVSNRQEFGT